MKSDAAPPLLELRELRYGPADDPLLAGVSLCLRRGEVFGLIGPNGAGKSTTLQLICGLLAPAAGEVLVGGHSLRYSPTAARRQIGYLPDPPALHPTLRVAESIALQARLYRLRAGRAREAVARALEQHALSAVAERPVGSLSKGYRQRLALAMALVHAPALVVLDEPGSGLDPAQNEQINRHIGALAAAGSAVIFSSHSLADVQACCSRIGCLGAGHIRERRHHTAPGPSRWRLQLREPVSAASLCAHPDVLEAAALDRHNWWLSLRCAQADALLAHALAAGWGPCALQPVAAPLGATATPSRRMETV